MDRGGTVTALDAASGQGRWTKELDGQGRGLRRRHVGRAAGPDRARRWTRRRATDAGCGPFVGTFTELATVGGPAGPGHRERDGAARRGRPGDRPAARVPAAHGRRRPDGRLGRREAEVFDALGLGRSALAAARPHPGGAGPPGGRRCRRACCWSTPTGPSPSGTMSAETAGAAAASGPAMDAAAPGEPVRFVAGAAADPGRPGHRRPAAQRGLAVRHCPPWSSRGTRCSPWPALTVILSGPIRQQSTLLISGEAARRTARGGASGRWWCCCPSAPPR